MERPRAKTPVPRSTGPELVMTNRSVSNRSVRTSRNRAGMLVRPLTSTVFWKIPRNMVSPGTIHHTLPLFTTLWQNYTRHQGSCQQKITLRKWNFSIIFKGLIRWKRGHLSAFFAQREIPQNFAELVERRKRRMWTG